jgi:hypothetical protein
LLVILSAGLLYSKLDQAPDRAPDFPIGQDMERVIGAARAARLPLDVGDELRALDRRAAFYREKAESADGGWMAWESIAGIHLARAQLTGDYRDYGEAEAALDRASAIAPLGSGPHLARAEFNLAVHRIASLPADLDAIGRDAVPGEAAPAALLGLRGEAAFYSGRTADALRDFRQADAAGRTTSTSLHLALFASRTGDDRGAARYLDEAERSIYGPQLALRSHIERSRGLFAIRRGDWRGAKTHFLAADRLFPGQWANLYYLALAAAAEGDTAKALAALEPIGLDRSIPEALDAAAILHRARGDRQAAELWSRRAEAIWRARMHLYPEAAAAHWLDHLLAFGAPAEALKVARLAYAARPFAESRIGLAWALIANNRPEDALTALAPVLGSDWSSAELHLAAAQAHALLGKGEEAEAERRKAEAINPLLGERNLPSILIEH